MSNTTPKVKRPCAQCGKSQYRKWVWEQAGKMVLCSECHDNGYYLELVLERVNGVVKSSYSVARK